MKYVIISDLHLGRKFEQSKFDAIARVISLADRVVINGDFWHREEVNFDQFVAGKWSALFPLLKAKKTIYLYGNHDPKKESDDRVSLWSDEDHESLDMDINGIKCHFEHGDKIAVTLTDKYPKIFDNIVVNSVCYWSMKAGTKAIGTKFFQYLPMTRGWKKKIIGFIKRSGFKNEGKLVFVGHTHFGEVNLGEGYVNSGWIRMGFCQHIEISQEGKVSLITETY